MEMMIAMNKIMQSNSPNGGKVVDKNKNMVPFPDLNIKLQERFDIIGEISKLIYDNKSEGKFVYNSFTRKN
jgi:hypothetical protein